MGKVYHEVHFIDSDDHGVLFRHRDGIAKENFDLLSETVQKLVAPAEVKMEGEEGKEPGKEEGEAGKKLQDYTLTLWHRVTYYPTAKPCGGHCDGKSMGCWLHRNPHTWPSHWHKFKYAHYLTNPACRELATRDFLYTTGLRPRPCGVRVYYFPSATPCHFR